MTPQIDKSAIEILSELAAGPERVNSCTLCSVMEDKEAELFKKYEGLKTQITQKWGPPDYSGYGPGTSVEIPELKGKLIDYTSMLDVSFWKRDRFIFLVMVTGHDANSLLCLTLKAIDCKPRIENRNKFGRKIKKNYYLIGCLFGALLTILINIFALKGALFSFVQLSPLPVISGFFVMLALGRLADKNLIQPTISKTITISVLLFLSGVLAGSFINLCMHSQHNPPYGVRHEIMSWFVTPIYWLVVFGLPYSICVGLGYFMAVRFCLRKSKKCG